jgi:flagellar protein FliO/FliZ
MAFAAGNGAGVGAGSVLQLLAGLAVVIGAIFGLAFLARRFGRFPTAAGRLRVVGGLSLGARERVVLVQVGEQQLLLGVAPGRVQTLHVLAQPLPLAPLAPAASGEGFAERLAALMRGRGAP